MQDAGFDAGKVEQIADQPVEPVGLMVYRLQEFLTRLAP
jgi:hypothetical protein